MNKDQVQGTVTGVKGKVQEVTGRVVGNPDLENKGDLNQVAGKIQKIVGNVEEQIKKNSK